MKFIIKLAILFAITLSNNIESVQASSYNTNHIYLQFKALNLMLGEYKIKCNRYPNSSEELLKPHKIVEKDMRLVKN